MSSNDDRTSAVRVLESGLCIRKGRHVTYEVLIAHLQNPAPLNPPSMQLDSMRRRIQGVPKQVLAQLQRVPFEHVSRTYEVRLKHTLVYTEKIRPGGCWERGMVRIGRGQWCGDVAHDDGKKL
jgi:hypothetical protein